MIAEAFGRLLAAECPPALVRAAAADPAAATPLERALADAGFADVLLPEAQGGAGLNLAQFAPLVIAAGAHLLPLRFPEQAVERWQGSPPDRVALAALTAAKMAGAIGRVLDLTVAHVTVRQQFGRPLAQFQAVQQQLALLAEETAAAVMAAHVGLGGAGFDVARSAAAKLRAHEAADAAIAIAHQLHGAIGATAEHDLPLWTGQLRRWQRQHGTAADWALLLARHRIGARPADSASYLRQALQWEGEP